MTRSLIILALLGLSATGVRAQDCQAVLNQLLSGGANVGWAMNAQNWYNANCLGQRQQPSYQPPINYPVSNNDWINRRTNEFAALGNYIQKARPLRKDIPLSAGTVRMETVNAPPPAPADYADPFAARTFPPIKESVAGPVKRYGSIWDPSQWVSMSPPAEPAGAKAPEPTSGPCGRYGSLSGVCAAPVTGFGR